MEDARTFKEKNLATGNEIIYIYICYRGILIIMSKWRNTNFFIIYMYIYTFYIFCNEYFIFLIFVAQKTMESLLAERRKREKELDLLRSSGI